MLSVLLIISGQIAIVPSHETLNQILKMLFSVSTVYRKTGLG